MPLQLYREGAARWLPIQSSHLSGVCYLEGFDLLLIEFKDGTIYLYPDVDVLLYIRFLQNESKGRFRARYIPEGFRVFRPSPTIVDSKAIIEMLEKSLVR